MGKFSVFFISLLFVLCACNQEEYVGNISSKAESAEHFYGVKRSAEGIQTRGIAQRRNLWHTGTTFKVRFLNGAEAYKQKVMTANFRNLHWKAFSTDG